MNKKTKIYLCLIITLIFGLFGVKSYLDKTYLDEFSRTGIIGNDRFETMVKISQEGWTKSDEAILVNITSVIDGISVTTFAHQKDIPIFFTESNELNSIIKDEFKRLGVKKIYISGGEKAISKDIEKELENMNVKYERVAGGNGFETSLQFAEKVNELAPISEVALVNMKYGKPNGVALSAATAKKNIPIIMVNISDRVQIIEFFEKHKIEKVYFLGSEDLFSKTFEEMLNVEEVIRINGEDRYDTNIQIIEEFYDLNEIESVYINRCGTSNYADFLNALSLSPIAAKKDKPILLSPDSLQEKQLNFLEKNEIYDITEVGFELTRSEIITEDIFRFISSILIIIVWILALKRILLLK